MFNIHIKSTSVENMLNYDNYDNFRLTFIDFTYQNALRSEQVKLSII